MTWTRQQRQHARMRELVEPYRRAAIQQALEYFLERQEPCLVGCPAGCGIGLIMELGTDHVKVGDPEGKTCTSIPLHMVNTVKPWPDWGPTMPVGPVVSIPFQRECQR